MHRITGNHILSVILVRYKETEAIIFESFSSFIIKSTPFSFYFSSHLLYVSSSFIPAHYKILKSTAPSTLFIIFFITVHLCERFSSLNHVVFESLLFKRAIGISKFFYLILFVLIWYRLNNY